MQWSTIVLVLATFGRPVAMGFNPSPNRRISVKKGSLEWRNDQKPVHHIRRQASAQDDESWMSVFTSDSQRSLIFSGQMTLCGALLGPFLDSYHSAFGVLQYDEPIQLVLWGTTLQPALTTAWWVPELFGVAGFLIGWLYILFDQIFPANKSTTTPSYPAILLGISLFTFQYWLSGVLSASGVDRETIFGIMSIMAAGGFILLDNTLAGLIVSLATAVGGPLIEVGLISMWSVYHYTDPGETGFFPLWIAPVYFLGGPAVGNLARGFWNVRGEKEDKKVSCEACSGSRCVACPNCEDGYYVTYGRRVLCNACRGQGLVICRTCFSSYDEDPNDIEAIRGIMARMPD